MEDSEEITEEVTEVLVLAELTGVIDNDFLLREHHHVKISGVDTDNPILQIDNSVFSGEYQDIKGTAVIFEEKKTDGEETELKYMCKTFKKLVLERVFLQERATIPASSGDESVHDTVDDQSNTASSTSNSVTANDQPSFTVSSTKEENMCVDNSTTQITADNSVKDSFSFPVSAGQEKNSVHEDKGLTTSDSNSTLTSCCLDETNVAESKILKEKKEINFSIPVDKPPLSSPETCISVLKSADREKSTTSDVEMTEFVEKLNVCSIKASEGSESRILEEMHIEQSPTAAACSKSATECISPSSVQSSQSQATGDKNTSESET